MEGWIVEHFTTETRIKSWDQLSEEEEKEDEGRGKWEDVSAEKAERVRESVCVR